VTTQLQLINIIIIIKVWVRHILSGHWIWKNEWTCRGSNPSQIWRQPIDLQQRYVSAHAANHVRLLLYAARCVVSCRTLRVAQVVHWSNTVSGFDSWQRRCFQSASYQCTGLIPLGTQMWWHVALHLRTRASCSWVKIPDSVPPLHHRLTAGTAVP